MSDESARGTPVSGRGRILVVDDELALQRAYARTLREAGHVVETANDGLLARELLSRQSFDVVLTDVSMPGLDGIGLLKAVREVDLDVPVVVATANPTPETAHQAVAYGATMFLVKPIDLKSLRQVVEHAIRIRNMAKLKRELFEHSPLRDYLLADKAGTEITFARALGSVWMAFQPIVSRNGELNAFEALVRSEEPALPNPGALFDAAERVDRLFDLGRCIREKVSLAIRDAPAAADIYVNLHTQDLMDDALYDEVAPLTEHAKRVVLEVTERASLERVTLVGARIARLRELGFRIAIDDLGAGYAGLTAFAQLHPDIVKLDISLVRDVHTEPMKLRLIESVTALCRDMGILVVAEGIEQPQERDALLSLGCDLLQGFFFARPSRSFEYSRPDAVVAR
jgi:EAL domain-containing protein (putative c-di-GMP-specific phosphodiesterase class I)/CheY-like chemotaxis protein